MDGSAILILSAVAACIALAIIVFGQLSQRSSRKNGWKKTASILKRFAFTRNYRTLSNVTLRLNGKDYPAENILVGYFGILLVKTLGDPGEYFGEKTDKTWSLVQGQSDTAAGTKTTLPNPLPELQETAAALRAFLVHDGWKGIRVETVVYLSNTFGKTLVYGKHGDEIQLPGKLKHYLNREMFETDTGLDVVRLTERLTSISTPSHP